MINCHKEKEVNSNLATAIRTIVVLVMAWGIATGASWLFYFKALQTTKNSNGWNTHYNGYFTIGFIKIHKKYLNFAKID